MTQDQMSARLSEFFPDAKFEITDLTGTADHWAVQISSMQFAGLSRMDQHQLVMKAFTNELKTGEVHALTIKTQTPIQ